jgi:hypothetical protein
MVIYELTKLMNELHLRAYPLINGKVRMPVKLRRTTAVWLMNYRVIGGTDG